MDLYRAIVCSGHTGRHLGNVSCILMVALRCRRSDTRSFFVVFLIEMLQDNGKVPYYEHTLKEKIPYDPEKQYAVIMASICNGEKRAGFKNYGDGHFTEVMLIGSMEDEKRFQQIYGLDSVKKEYLSVWKSVSRDD